MVNFIVQNRNSIVHNRTLLMHDKAGAVVDGAPDKIVDVTDIWTFAHDAGSRDPNWKLIATESGH